MDVQIIKSFKGENDGRADRHFIEKKIVPGTHTIEEVEEYLKSRYGFVEADRTDSLFY